MPSTIFAVTTPGRSELRAAMASDNPSRIRSCAGLPITVWSKSRMPISTRPSVSASGPRLPTWQSPQIQMAGPCGNELAAIDASHS